MRTVSTVFITACGLLLLAACSGHDMRDSSMAKEMTGMEQPMESMEAKPDAMMEDGMAGETGMMPNQDTMTGTMP